MLMSKPPPSKVALWQDELRALIWRGEEIAEDIRERALHEMQKLHGGEIVNGKLLPALGALIDPQEKPAPEPNAPWLVVLTIPRQERNATEWLMERKHVVYCPRTRDRVYHGRRSYRVIDQPLFRTYFYVQRDGGRVEDQAYQSKEASGVNAILRPGPTDRYSLIPDGFVLRSSRRTSMGSCAWSARPPIGSTTSARPCGSVSDRSLDSRLWSNRFSSLTTSVESYS
jgi:hypothetical protein